MRVGRFGIFVNVVALSAMLFTSGCAMVGVPEARNVDIPAPTKANARKQAINERPDSVMYLPLGEDVLVPEASQDDDFPKEMVGPFELRGETLAGALQLILADYDISLAFETQEGLTRRITVANLRGDLGKVVHQVCSLANLYCSYEDGTIVIKDTQTFTVTLPPIGTDDETDFLDDVAEGLGAILNPASASTGGAVTTQEPIVDPTTRTIVYAATQRTADIASRYFQRLRANTAMIVFETYIWEVSLNSGNSTGIDWSKIETFGKFNASLALDGSVGADFLSPISIGLPTTQDINGTPTDIIQFLSQFGAVKTISQPQITVLSGSEAELRVADTQNYVSQIATTLDEGQSTTSVNTDSVDTGFTLTIGSTWDKATVYANVNIELTDVKQIDDFTFADTGDSGGETRIQLPQTSERQLSTQIRVRPGDAVLIAGLVRENDNFDTRGIGFMSPIVPDSRTAQTENLELVILLRPRVIVYTAQNDQRYVDFAMKKHRIPGAPAEVVSPKVDLPEPTNVYKDSAASVPAVKSAPVVNPVQEQIPSGIPAPLSPEPLAVTPQAQPLALPPATPVVPASAVPQAVSAPATPSWDKTEPAPMPILRDAPPVSPSSMSAADDGSRFRRSGGFVSRGADAPVVTAPHANSAYPAPQAYTPPAPAPVPMPAPASVTTYPVAPAPVAMPKPATPLYGSPVSTPPAQPSAPLAAPSPYETYDYYTPSY